MLLYPVGRFLLEMIRTDEPGQFGTDLTISQWISCLIFLGGVVLGLVLRARPARPLLPPTAAIGGTSAVRPGPSPRRG
jgi:phosphatidylglycerol:prolipoprotein diacylglycerol transferase